MTKIYYFSGTGNSLWSARKIAESIGNCEMYNIGVEADKESVTIEAETVIFVFPAYAYGLPVVVKKFIKRAVIKADYVASFCTYGSSPGGTLGVMRRILKKKNIKKMYFKRIPAVENFMVIFGTPTPKKIQRRTAMQKKATDEAIIAIKERRENKVNTFTPGSGFVSVLFSLGRMIFYKYYHLSKDLCNGCAVCRKICPVGAIIMKDNHPVFTSKCEFCVACIDVCPQRAIQYGQAKFGKPGYRHPEIEIIDLAR